MANHLNKELKHEADVNERVMFGFWVYLMTDLLMFTILFAVYAVLNNSVANGPTGRDLFNLPQVLTETMLLLTSSFVCGLAMLAARQGKKNFVMGLLGVTYLLGLIFATLEWNEFADLIQRSHTPQSSAFLSSYFTLVGAHGLHIVVGLLWLGVMIVFIQARGLTKHMVRKLTLFSLYWHFLDLVWIFIFTIVYLRAFI